MMATTAHTLPRQLAGLAGAFLFAAGSFFLSSYLDRSVGAGVGAAALVVCLSAALWPSSRAPVRLVPLVREAVAFVALATVGLLVATYLFAHLSADRYLWAISLAGACSHLGSAAVAFTAAMVTLMFAAGAAGVLISDNGAYRAPWRGLVLGLAVAAVSVIFGAALPEIAARALGCL